MRIGLSGLVGTIAGGLEVYECVGSAPEVTAALARHPDAVAIIDNDLDGGGSLAVVADCLARGDRPPIVSIVDAGPRRQVPWGFAQAVVGSPGVAAQIELALTVALAGGTYVDPVLRGIAAMSADLGHPGILTQREAQMLREISRGQGSKQIALAEGISTETVKTHVANLMRKLNVATRAHAVAKAYDLDLLGDDHSIVSSSSGSDVRHVETMLYGSYSEAAGEVLEYLQRTVGFDTWMMTEQVGTKWVVLESAGAPSPGPQSWNDSLCRRTLETDGPRFSDDLQNSPHLDDVAAAVRYGIHAYLGVPLFDTESTRVATLCAFGTEPREHLERAEMLRIEKCAQLLLKLFPQDPPPRTA